MKKLLWTTFCVVLVLSGCSQENKEKAGYDNNSNNNDNSASLTALSAAELAEYLPDGLSGYPYASDIDSIIFDHEGVKYITVVRDYKKTENENVTISLQDYAEAQELYIGKSMAWGKQSDYETETVTFTFVQIAGEDARKKASKTNDYKDIIMGVKDRFVLSIEGDMESFNLFVSTLENIAAELKAID